MRVLVYILALWLAFAVACEFLAALDRPVDDSGLTPQQRSEIINRQSGK